MQNGQEQKLSFFQKAWQKIRPYWRRVENVLFGLLLLLVALYFILQSSIVQNWLIQKTATYLSEELQTEVRVGHVDISLFDNLVLEGLYVEDLKGDTLLYAGALTAGLNSNIFSLLANKLEFNEISLSKARFYLRRAAGERQNNLQFILDYFSRPPKPKTDKSGIRLRIQNLHLKDVRFVKEDWVQGQRMVAVVPEGSIRVNNLDPAAKIIDIQSVQLDRPEFAVADYHPQPLPQGAQPPGRPVSLKVDSSNVPKAIPLQITVQKLAMRDGRFSLNKYNSSRPPLDQPGVMDYEHLVVRKIDLEADSVRASDALHFSGILRQLSAAERSGFFLKHLEARRMVVTDTLAALYGMRLETPGSTLGDTLTFQYSRYRDFRDFNNRVFMKAAFKPGSKVMLGDIMHFSPGVAKNSFFNNNRSEVVEIEGGIDGLVNRLNGRNLHIRLGNDTEIIGDFDGNDMAEGSDQIRLIFDFEQVLSNMRTIRKIIPGFNAPEYFNRLGNINFKGSYQIFFSTSHILNGSLKTDLGNGNVDMKLDLAGGPEKATYSGFLQMAGFNVAKWAGNSDFGKSTFRINIEDGSGLTLQTVRAKLTGVVDSFTFRGYNYQNVEMNGEFDRARFDGKLNIEDPNINFTFDGNINLKDSVPVYDFQADLKRLDLKTLNLVKEDWVLSGRLQKIKLIAKDINNIGGYVLLRDFRLIQDKQYVHKIDSLTFAAYNRPGAERHFVLLSDIANGSLEGRFDLANMGRNLVRLFYQNFPELTKQALGSAFVPDSLPLTDSYKFNLIIKNTEGLTRLIDPALDTLQNISLRAVVQAGTGFTEFRFQAPRIRYNGLDIRGTDFYWRSTNTLGSYGLSIPNALLANGQRIAHLSLKGSAEHDQLTFLLQTSDSASIVEQMNLSGTLSAGDSLWQVKFDASDITLFSEQWYMDDDNFLRFSHTYFEARNFDLMSGVGNRRIVVDNFNEGRGVALSVANFDINFVEKFLPSNKVHYRGKIYNLDVEIYDLFQLKQINGYITTDTVFINEQPYGVLSGNVELADTEAPLWWQLFLRDKEKRNLKIQGAWARGRRSTEFENELGVIKAGEFQTRVNASNFPMEVLELFVPGISKTSGDIDAEVRLGGPVDRIAMRGTAWVDGHFQLDYLKAMFYLRHQAINLSEYQISADGDTIFDGSQKNYARIRGGLRHDHFENWRLDCSVASKNDSFMILNTLRDDNTMYYGQGIGKFEARFTGSFSKTNIFITAKTGDGTRLYIPLYENADIQDNSFITFKSKNEKTVVANGNKFILEDLKGLNLEMNLTITESAEVQLIFDEQSGDIIKGRGGGDIRMVINREGEFKMYGTYQIEKGEYLFTLLNWINKPFTVAKGGVISWTGDPFDAQISIDATYSENTSLYNLLRDELAYLENSNADGASTSRAGVSTLAVVTMHLKGDLFKPNISFDLSFPNITSQLKSLVDSKLTQLRQDQNEMIRQVFGLVVVGSFLPPTTSTSGNLQSSDYIASAFNTLTQVLSNQFSRYLTGLATEWFGGTVSSIDFDIVYSQDIKIDPSENLSQVGRELQVRLTSGFVNDRVTVQLGSQFGLGQQPGASTDDGFLGEDVTVEIQITENRQWRLKVYQRTEPDLAGGARRSRYGIGVSFRKEYDSFSELMRGLTGWFLQKKD